MPGIFFRRGMTAGILCLSLGLTMPVYAAEQESESILSSVGEAQIKPVGDGAETYLLKSEGFYCLKEDGTRHEESAVHYLTIWKSTEQFWTVFIIMTSQGILKPEIPTLSR